MTSINTNVNALFAQSSLTTNQVAQSTAMQQLSTGLRINSSKDDAAGLAIATRMNSNVRGLAVAIRNANDGISMAQTAESSLGSVVNMLQRMRELAVQSVNGTLTSQNRSNMQIEVGQLVSEINNVSKTANFNGIKLFDGSAATVVLQTNTAVNDIVKMGISRMDASTLGVGTVPSIQGQGLRISGANASTGVSAGDIGTINGSKDKTFAVGDMVINGIMIGASIAATDTISPQNADAAASGISKVAAINAKTDLTGVRATVQATQVSGVKMTAGSAGNSATITINGVTTSKVVLTGNTAADRAATLQAINGITAATGVHAVDTETDVGGVQLIADDGRNVYAYLSNQSPSATSGSTIKPSAKNFGIDAGDSITDQSVFTSGFSLQSVTESPITITTTASGDLTKSGLVSGTYAINHATVSTNVPSAVSASGGTATSLATGDMVINGSKIPAALSSTDTLSMAAVDIPNSSSAISLAAAINTMTSQTGVSAVANPNVIQGIGYSAGAFSGSVTINGSTVLITSAATSTLDSIVDTINTITNTTGVVASNNGLGLTLTASDGRNISISYSPSLGTISNIGLANSVISSAQGQDLSKIGQSTTLTPPSTVFPQAAVFTASVRLVSDKVFTVQAGANADAVSHLQSLGIKEGLYGGNNNGVKVSTMDISSVYGANRAIEAVDSALAQISDMRSNLGAIQNRLVSAIENLTSSQTNMQQSVSRIQDTDYSTATTAMSRAQIINQAATAMLAQANQQSQLVLQLLK